MKTKRNIDFRGWQIAKDRTRLQKQILEVARSYGTNYQRSSIVETSILALLDYLVEGGIIEEIITERNY